MTTEHYWIVQHRTYDPSREIGSMSATKVEAEARLDYDPIAKISAIQDAVRHLADEARAHDDPMVSRWLAGRLLDVAKETP